MAVKFDTIPCESLLLLILVNRIIPDLSRLNTRGDLDQVREVRKETPGIHISSKETQMRTKGQIMTSQKIECTNGE